MYRLFKMLLLLAVILTLSCITAISEAANKNIAVMPVYTSSATVQSGTETIIYKLVAENMTAQLITALHNSNKYSVLEREEVKQGLANFDIQAGKVIDQAQATKVGKHLEANYSIIGKVNLAKVINNEDKNTLQDIKNRIEQQAAIDEDSENSEVARDEDSANVISSNEYDFQGKINVELKLIDNETNTVVFKDEFKSIQSGETGADSLRAACKAVAQDFVSQIENQVQTEKKAQPEKVPQSEQPQPERQDSSDSITIIDVSGDVVYIDKGVEIGLQEGDILNVIKKEPVKNMKGQIITYKTSIVGKLEIQVVNEGHCICKIIEEISDKSIKRGNIAEKAVD